MTEWVTSQRLTSGVPAEPGFVRRDHSGCRQPTEPRCYEHPFTGPDLSPAEAATVARFDAAPDAEESLRERVAAAIADAPVSLVSTDGRNTRRACLVLADAAIAVIRGDDA